MDKIALSLGLAATASQEDIIGAIAKLKQDNATEKVQLALKLAREDGRVTDANQDKFLRLAGHDLELALEMFGKPEAPAAPTGAGKGLTLSAAVTNAQRQNAQAQSDGTTVTLSDKRKDWDMRKWETTDPKGLVKLRNEQPDAYQVLYDAYYSNKL